MVPENYHYVDETPQHSCLNCKHRWVAFHIATGTSFCELQKLRTTRSCDFICDQWENNYGEKAPWTQNLEKAFRMPVMETSDKVTKISYKGQCKECKNFEISCGIGFCNRYFEELAGTDRTVKMCEVARHGKCVFFIKKEKNLDGE